MDQIPKFDKITCNGYKFFFYNDNQLVYWIGECRPNCGCAEDWNDNVGNSTNLVWEKIGECEFEANLDGNPVIRLKKDGVVQLN